MFDFAIIVQSNSHYMVIDNIFLHIKGLTAEDHTPVIVNSK